MWVCLLLLVRDFLSDHGVQGRATVHMVLCQLVKWFGEMHWFLRNNFACHCNSMVRQSN